MGRYRFGFHTILFWISKHYFSLILLGVIYYLFMKKNNDDDVKNIFLWTHTFSPKNSPPNCAVSHNVPTKIMSSHIQSFPIIIFIHFFKILAETVFLLNPLNCLLILSNEQILLFFFQFMYYFKMMPLSTTKRVNVKKFLFSLLEHLNHISCKIFLDL